MNKQSLAFSEVIRYLKKLDFEFRMKWFWKLALFGIALWMFSLKYAFTINLSDSLPGTVYLIVKNPDHIDRGDLVAYKYFGYLYPRKTPFMKEVTGVHGDVISEKNREFFINGHSVGTAKQFSKTGQPLWANSFEGVIPPGKLWVSASSKDSLDSRYEDNGLISEGQVAGKAYKLW